MTAELRPGVVVALDALQGERFVVETVRRGGMGMVSKLVALRPGMRAAAFKTYLQLGDPEQFNKEARAWSSLSGHPHIARLDWFGRWHDVSATLGAWYPRSLAEVSFAADPDKGLDLIVGIVKALVHAVGERGILHRDLKPTNVLIDDENAARLGDFGLASALTEGEPVSLDGLTASMRSIATVGSVAGTPLYMAPELFSGAKQSASSELFSLGVTIYEFVTAGEHPYLGAETGLRFKPSLREEPLSRVPWPPGQLQEVLRSLLALEASARPRSFEDVLAALEQAGGRRRRSSVNIAVEAATLRSQGRLEAARAVLDEGLQDRPGDPVLLNGLALVYREEGDRTAAAEALETATQRLFLTEGRYEGHVYADPVINLARELIIHEHEFARAEEILAQAEVWLSSSSDYKSWYPELAWLYLWRGDFSRACEHLHHSLAARESTDLPALAWFVLAAWLSGQQDHWAHEIARHLHGRITEWPAGMLALVVADTLPAGARDSLAAGIPPGVRNDLRAVLTQANAPTTMSFPLDPQIVSLVVGSLDYENTGGKFSTDLRPT